MGKLKIRRGSAADEASVKFICFDAEDGHDYIPQVWNEWVADPQNQAYIFELDGQPAALYFLRLGIAGPKASWIQGLRVATPFKRRGLAATVVAHAQEASRQQGYTVLRYTTAELNSPMHRLANRFGFRHVGNFLNYHYDISHSIAQPSGPALRQLTLTELEPAYELITRSAEFKADESFYSVAWLWKPLSLELLAEHIKQGEVFSLANGVEALAIATKEPDENHFWLAFIAGQEKEAQSLMPQLLNKLLSAQPGATMDALVPQTALAEKLLVENGFIPDAREAVMWLYEKVIATA